MADYKDYYRNPCSYCGEWYGHKEDCSSPYMQRVRLDADARENGFEPIGETTHPKPELYLCQRGCGTVVWDTEAHRKNVCT